MNKYIKLSSPRTSFGNENAYVKINKTAMHNTRAAALKGGVRRRKLGKFTFSNYTRAAWAIPRDKVPPQYKLYSYFPRLIPRNYLPKHQLISQMGKGASREGTLTDVMPWDAIHVSAWTLDYVVHV
jgi:hypothetical protein